MGAHRRRRGRAAVRARLFRCGGADQRDGSLAGHDGLEYKKSGPGLANCNCVAFNDDEGIQVHAGKNMFVTQNFVTKKTTLVPAGHSVIVYSKTHTKTKTKTKK